MCASHVPGKYRLNLPDDRAEVFVGNCHKSGLKLASHGQERSLLGEKPQSTDSVTGQERWGSPRRRTCIPAAQVGPVSQAQTWSGRRPGRHEPPEQHAGRWASPRAVSLARCRSSGVSPLAALSWRWESFRCEMKCVVSQPHIQIPGRLTSLSIWSVSSSVSVTINKHTQLPGHQTGTSALFTQQLNRCI